MCGSSVMEDSRMVLCCAWAASRGDGTFDALPEDDCDDLRLTALGLVLLLAVFTTNVVLLFGAFCNGSLPALCKAYVGLSSEPGVGDTPPDPLVEAVCEPTSSSRVNGVTGESGLPRVKLSKVGEMTRAVFGS